MAQYPTVFSTADIIVHDDQGNFIVGRKAQDKDKWRLPGGFIDPELDGCYLDGAVREASEELSQDFIELASEFVYLGDYEIQDSRYKDTPHTVFTNLYAVKVDYSDEFSAGDDLDVISILKMDSVLEEWGRSEHIITEHQKLVAVYVDYFLNSSYSEDTKSS